MASSLDAEERRRLSTWATAIARYLRDAPVAHTSEGLRLGRKGSLSVTTAGNWHDYEAGCGGEDPLSLIRHLRGCKPAGAILWARTWLTDHPGDGALNDAAEAAAEEAGERRAIWARQVLVEAIDPTGTPAAAYLESRGLAAPFPGHVRYLPDARTGEGAIVGMLTAPDGKVVGLQLGFLDPQGRKSTVLPRRQLFLLDKEKAGQGAFRNVAEPAEDAVPVVICDGLEDALSIAQSAAARMVLGIPGVGRLGKFDPSAGTELVVFKDGDATDSGAAKQLDAAINRWVSAGVSVRVTATPPGEDANSILQAKGAEELRRLIAEAEPAKLGFNVDVERLAALGTLEYEKERAAAATRHGVRVAFIDAATKAVREEATALAAAAADEDESLHPDPVPDLAEVLDAGFAETRRYVVASEHDLAAAVLWAAHAHFVHHETVYLPVSPKLAIQSPDRGCGKSTMLEVIGALVPRPEIGSSITASVVFRLIEAKKPTLLLDEADRIIRSSNDDLIAILNSSHRRAGAYVWRTEEIAGQHVPTKFSTWGPCAFAGIRELPPTLQDRSVVIRLARAKPGEVAHHLRNGTSPALRLIKQKLARAAADMTHLPDPQLPPGLHNRAGDNWSPLFSVAAVAGGRWPGLVTAAALAGLAADQQEGTLVALLEGIRRAFGELARISTRALLDFLLADDEYDWASANRGRPINEAWLRERLRGVVAPAANGKPGSERWGSGNAKERGYSRDRFEDAWVRYLPSSLATPDLPAHPAHPAPPLKTNGDLRPDEHVGIRPPSESIRPPESNGAGPDAEVSVAGCETGHAAQKNPIKSMQGPDGPDGPGILGVPEEGMPLSADNDDLGDEELL